MLTYADALDNLRMLTYADVCRRMLMYADALDNLRMLTYADVC